ncbi:hypothetical protein OY671_012600, partial [Metschnikowia pulcherrima]
AAHGLAHRADLSDRRGRGDAGPGPGGAGPAAARREHRAQFAAGQRLRAASARLAGRSARGGSPVVAGGGGGGGRGPFRAGARAVQAAASAGREGRAGARGRAPDAHRVLVRGGSGLRQAGCVRGAGGGQRRGPGRLRVGHRQHAARPGP